MASDGKQIGERLVKLLEKCTPYVRAEVSSKYRFDVVAYVPTGSSLPVEERDKSKVDCLRVFRRKYCHQKWNEARQRYENPARKEFTWEKGVQPPPPYKHRDRLYEVQEQLWPHVKDTECVCDGLKCEEYQKQLERERMGRKKYGWLEGLHMFEVKSDMDDYSRLVYQIPQMLLIADHAWLVLGEEQEIPAWLPPYIGVIRFIEKGKKFKFERIKYLPRTEPPMYRHVIEDHNIKIEFKGEPFDLPYTLEMLFKKWCINSMFRWQHEGHIVLDMTKELDKLQCLALKVRGQGPLGFQRMLTDFGKVEEAKGDG